MASTKNAKPETKGSRAPRVRTWYGRLARAGFALLVAAAVCLYIGYRVVTSSWFLTPRFERALTEMTGAQVTVKDARYLSGGLLQLHDVEVRVPGVVGPAGELVRIPTADIRIALVSLRRLHLVVESIVLNRPLIRISEDTRSHTITVGALNRPASVGESQQQLKLPTILVMDATIEVGLHDSTTHEYTPTGTLNLDGKLLPMAPDENPPASQLAGPSEESYQIILTELPEARIDADVGPVRPIEILGRLGIETGTLSLDVTGINFDTDRSGLLPTQVREWWNLIEPRGPLGSIRFIVDADGKYGARIDMSGIDWTMPIRPALNGNAEFEPADGDDDDPFSIGPRLTDVQGSIYMHEKGIQLIGLSGALEGVRYRLCGQFGPLMHATGDASKLTIPDFNLWFEVDEFDLQRDLTVLAAVPQPQRQWIQRQLTEAVTLQGIIDADIHLYRNLLNTDLQQEGSYLSALWGRDEWLSTGRYQSLPTFETPRPMQQNAPLGFDGRITIKTASGMVSAFPYPLTGIMGTIWFDAEGVEIADLAASGPDGEGIIMSGRIEHLGPEPKLDLDIVAANVPLEGYLRDALGPRNGKALNTLMHEPSARSLHEAGAFITPDEVEEIGDELLRIVGKLNRGDGTEQQRSELEQAKTDLEQQLYKPVFSLGGRVNITTHVAREAGKGNATVAESTVRLSRTGRSVGLLYEEFPYPVYLVAGELRVGFDRIEITKDLVLAGPTGARALVSGYIDRVRAPERRIKSHLYLTIADAPIDPLLLYAIPGADGPNSGEPTNLEQRELTGGARFLAGLMLDGVIEANGPIDFYDDQDHTGFEIDLSINSASSMKPEAADARRAMFDELDWQWPNDYPISDVMARAHLSRDQLTIHELSARHEQEQLAAQATIDWSVNDQPAVIDVTVDGKDMVFAPRLCELLGSLAQKDHRETLNRFWQQYDPRGTFDLDLEYLAGGGRSTASHRLDIYPDTISVMMDAARVGLNDSEGTLILSEGTLRFDDLRGRLECHDDDLGALTLNGEYAWNGGRQTVLNGELIDGNLNEEFMNLTIGRLADDEVDGSSNPESQDASGSSLHSWEPRLSGQATFMLHFSDEGHLDSYAIDAIPTQAQFTWMSQRYELSSLQGRVKLTPDRIDLNNVSGNFQDGSFELNGWTRFVGNRLQATELSYSGSATHFSDRLRMLIPDSPRQAIDAINLRSDQPVRIDDAALTYARSLHPDGNSEQSRPRLGPASFDFKSHMSVASAALDISVPVTELRADISVQASRPTPAEAETPVEYLITVEAERMRVKDRAATNGFAQIESSPDGSTLLLSDFSAECYGGLITARGHIDMPGEGQDGSYQFDLAMDGVGIGPLINPPGGSREQTRPTAAADGHSQPVADEGNTTGTTRASLSVAGGLGNRDSRRGIGMARVYKAKLYNVPVIMAVLQLSSLSLPIASAFDFVELSFCLEGDSVQIEDLSLHSSNVVLNGSGTVNIDSGALDLWLHTTARLRTPLLTDIWESIRDALLGIHVTGTLDEPVRSIVPFAHNDQDRGRVIGTHQAAHQEAGPEPADSSEPRHGG